MAKRNPWGFKIDYDKAIAEDEKWIAIYQRALMNGYYVPSEYPGAASWTLLNLAIYNSVVAADLLLDVDALVSAASVCDIDLAQVRASGFMSPFHGDLSQYQVTDGWYRRGEAVLDRLNTVWPDSCLCTADQLQAKLKAAKTALARHKRNKAKYGE